MASEVAVLDALPARTLREGQRRRPLRRRFTAREIGGRLALLLIWLVAEALVALEWVVALAAERAGRPRWA